MDALLEFGGAPFLIMGIVFSLLIGAFVQIIFMRVELTRIRDSYGMLLDYLGGGESRDILQELALTLSGLDRANRMMDKDITQLYTLLAGCVQKFAVVRYNAFQNVGSDQSFSIALLDSEDSGVVISGIYGRDSSTTYAKPIKSGYSDYVLTEEEEDAIGLARRRYIDMSYYKGNA